MIIASNIDSMSIQNHLRLRERTASTAMQRLSSGLRINYAADDPSGLAIVTGMRARIGGLNMAVQNIQDGISMLRTTEGSLSKNYDFMLRIRDLAIRGANEAILTQDDRNRIQAEIDSLIDEINRSADTTTYNSKHVTTDQYNRFNSQINIQAPVEWSGYAAATQEQKDAYDALKVKIDSIIAPCLEKVYGMLGMALEPTAQITIDYDWLTIANTAAALGGGGTGPPQHITIFPNLNFFIDLGVPAKVGYDPAVHQMTLEQLMVHEMAHGVFHALGGSGGDPWGQELVSTFASEEVDKNLLLGPAFIRNHILTDPLDVGVDYPEIALAAMFISEVHGTNKFREMCEVFIHNGKDWNAAIETVLGGSYDDGPGTIFEEFEKASDAWSAAYIDNKMYNQIDYGGFAFSAKPPNVTPANEWYLQIGPDNNSINRKEIRTPWGGAGAFGYLPFANVLTQDAAQRSIVELDKAIAGMDNALPLIGRQEITLRHALEDIMCRSSTSNRRKAACWTRIWLPRSPCSPVKRSSLRAPWPCWPRRTAPRGKPCSSSWTTVFSKRIGSRISANSWKKS